MTSKQRNLTWRSESVKEVTPRVKQNIWQILSDKFLDHKTWTRYEILKWKMTAPHKFNKIKMRMRGLHSDTLHQYM